MPISYQQECENSNTPCFLLSAQQSERLVCCTSYCCSAAAAVAATGSLCDSRRKIIRCMLSLPTRYTDLPSSTIILIVRVETSVGQTSGRCTTQLAKMSIDPNIIELITADVLGVFFSTSLQLHTSEQRAGAPTRTIDTAFFFPNFDVVGVKSSATVLRVAVGGGRGGWVSPGPWDS